MPSFEIASQRPVIVRDAGLPSVRLELHIEVWEAGGWVEAAVEPAAEPCVAEAISPSGAARVTLRLTESSDQLDYHLRLAAEQPTIVRLRLAVPEARNPYHVLPGFIYGDNNLHWREQPVFQHLTTEPLDELACSPFWSLRADRLANAVAMLSFEGGAAGISVAPYCDDARDVMADRSGASYKLPDDRPGFVRNGVMAELAHDGRPDAVGVLLGYANQPRTVVAKRTFHDPTWDALSAGSTAGSIWLQPAADRRELHRFVEANYQVVHREKPPRLSLEETRRQLVTGMVASGWIGQDLEFHDLKWNFEQGRFESLRGPNGEIGWTGGAQTAYPLLVAGHRMSEQAAIDKATTVLDRIAEPASRNPASGLFWDFCGRDPGRRHNGGWWAQGEEPPHCAYTNGHAVTYLLAAARYAEAEMGLDRSTWRDAALGVLDRVLEEQSPSGVFPYSFSMRDGKGQDLDGFAGVWFVPGLVLAHGFTGDRRFLDAADAALRGYHRFVADLYCYATPMDTVGAVDQEGVLGFIRAARLMHEQTGAAEHLEMLRDGALYEFLWRFADDARPEAPPLKDADWSIVGGSITSVSNHHVHPMGIVVTGDLDYLARHTGDAYVRARADDGLRWTADCAALFPERAGFGHVGTIPERFCPSDGLLTEKYPDGTAASVWFTMHVWGVANMLEGVNDRLGV